MRLTAWIWTVLPLTMAYAAAPERRTPAAGPDEQPGTVALVIDTSGSVRGSELTRAQQIAAGILQGMPSGSEIAVFGFDDQSRLVQPRTSNGDEVRRAIQGLHSAGRYTALYDALYDASRYLRDAPGARKAIVLLTDGKDENSALNLEDGLRVAEQSGLPVFAVGVGRVEERVMRRIAKITGGSYFPAAAVSGGEIASAILEVPPQATVVAASPPPAPPETHPSASPRAARPAPAPVAPAHPLGRWWPWAALAAVLVATGAGLATRRRRPAAAAGVAPSPAAGPTDDTLKPHRESPTARVAPPAPSTSASGEIESPTLVMRAPEDEEAGHTLVLRAWSVLAVLEGPAAGQAFELSHESGTSIGRGLNNDIVLDDAAVSSQHCRIRPEAEGFVVHDLDSTNGTYVNDRRVTRHVLAEGDQIRIGESLLQYRTDQRRG
ncbi:MAG TPA: FHA domain-containing protein [Vicinamibacteria bacterium]